MNREYCALFVIFQNNIPVFSPALTDGSIGDMLYFHTFKSAPGLSLDIVAGLHFYNILYCTCMYHTGTCNVPVCNVPVIPTCTCNGPLAYINPSLIMFPKDVRLINQQAMYAKKSGIIILGGGLIKHHVCNANMMVISSLALSFNVLHIKLHTYIS